MKATNQELEAVVDRSGLPGKFKAWIYQHVQGFTCGPCWCTSSHCQLFRALRGGSVTICTGGWACHEACTGTQTNWNSPRAAWMRTLWSPEMQYRESSYPEVPNAGIEVRTGRRVRAKDAVDQAESWLCHSMWTNRAWVHPNNQLWQSPGQRRAPIGPKWGENWGRRAAGKSKGWWGCGSKA